MMTSSPSRLLDLVLHDIRLLRDRQPDGCEGALRSGSGRATVDDDLDGCGHPVAAGSRWLGIYGVQGSADNLTRITVDGEANNTNFLQVTVNRSGAGHVLTWERVPYDSQP